MASAARASHRAQPRRERRARPVPGDPEGARPAQLIIDCKYANELPKPPVPKLLKAVPNADRLCQYAPTSLELDHRPLLLSEQDLLAAIELVDPEAYGDLPAEGSMPPPPPPQDAQLLRDDDVDVAVKEAERKRRRLTENTEAFHREAFGLQLPQLITNDVFTERQRFTTGLSAAEKKIHRDPIKFGSVEELEERIEKTFTDAREIPVHPFRPGVKPKRVLSIVPDAVLWANRYRQVVFDEIPKPPEPNDLLFKTVPTPRATCFGYFSSAGEGGDSRPYQLAQNYIWENRGGFTRASTCGEGEAILLSMPPPGDADGEVRFVPVPTLMRLKKQKAFKLDLNLETKGLNVKHRDPSAQEQAEERLRMSAVLSDEGNEKEGSSIVFKDGEWRIPHLHRHSSSREQTPPESPVEAPLPITVGS